MPVSDKIATFNFEWKQLVDQVHYECIKDDEMIIFRYLSLYHNTNFPFEWPPTNFKMCKCFKCSNLKENKDLKNDFLLTSEVNTFLKLKYYFL